MCSGTGKLCSCPKGSSPFSARAACLAAAAAAPSPRSGYPLCSWFGCGSSTPSVSSRVCCRAWHGAGAAIKVQPIALPSATSQTGNSIFQSVRLIRSSVSWLGGVIFQGCPGTAAGLVQESSRELRVEIRRKSLGKLWISSSCGCWRGPG